jgi:hypothetical protein
MLILTDGEIMDMPQTK